MYSKQYYYWWQTQDDRLWGDIGYLYSENINPFNSSGYVELSRKPTLVQTTWSLATDMQTIKYNNTEYKVFISSATIFKKWTTSAWGQNLDKTYPDVPDRQIKHFFQVWDWVYWTYEGDWSEMIIWRFENSEIANSSMTTPTYGYSWLTWTLSPRNPTGVYKLLKIWNLVYLTCGTKIDLLDFGTGQITNFDFWEDEIVGIDYNGNNIVLAVKWGALWYWDWVSESPWSRYVFPDYIVDTITLWTSTYAITGQYQWYGLTSPSLYKFWDNGIEKMFTQTKSETINESKFRIVFNSNQSIAKLRDFIVFIDQANTGEDRIAVYGNRPWLPNAYVVLNTRNSNGDNFTEIWFIKWYGNELYIGWYDWTSYGVDVINFDPFADFTYESTGYICTNTEDMQDKVIRKARCQLFTRLDNIDANNTAILSANIDGAWYETIATVTELDSSDIDRQSITWDFRDISLKVTLTSQWTTSPRLYWQKLQDDKQGI